MKRCHPAAGLSASTPAALPPRSPNTAAGVATMSSVRLDCKGGIYGVFVSSSPHSRPRPDVVRLMRAFEPGDALGDVEGGAISHEAELGGNRLRRRVRPRRAIQW